MAKAVKPTGKQRDFAQAYATNGGNAAEAYRTAYDVRKMGVNSIASASAELTRNPLVLELIAAYTAKAQCKFTITAAMVLERWWKIALADPNELITHRRVGCRHCNGIGHGYQWIDGNEWAAEAAKMLLVEREPPSNAGGYGYRPNLAPVVTCPQCGGEGVGDTFVHDTRKLSDSARLLYDGVKQTKDGIQVLLVDRSKALENIARHLGMFNDRAPGAANGNPMTVVNVNAKSAAEASRIYQQLMES